MSSIESGQENNDEPNQNDDFEEIPLLEEEPVNAQLSQSFDQIYNNENLKPERKKYGSYFDIFHDVFSDNDSQEFRST